MLGRWFQRKREPKKTMPKPKDKPIKKLDLKVTKDSNIAELAAEYPKLAQVLAEDYGLHCVGCFASSFDTLESGAQVHGMGEKEIDKMVVRLNRILEKRA